MNDETVLNVTSQVPEWNPWWMQRLCSQDEVEEQPEKTAEDEQGARVGLPALRHRGVDPQHAVREPLERPDDGGEEHALAGEHTRHVAAQERHDRGEDEAEDDDLQPALHG
jgi:hypothetical protein